ncbi:MerR family transcriptional regulator [Enterovirga rhinocerotis]|uniref:DNA-binding transcriptional MerR regulator n=1 Tax=Enterovirga rhinocerotis TaxID=1339210 RepID=A0A4R7BX73_9HYPH|nr:helix-turn-helix domain-containing protein [Enterovirga rhinocerotis]TDR89812.1 DNA-binding transcriptional MerR regulator [Enterovirga rhinocerotis]
MTASQSTASEGLPIGAVSKRTGVKVPTIRYYEEVGLMPPAPRSDGNRRFYGEAAIRRLAFIRHARELGFEIEAIRDLLALSAEPQASCEAADGIALRHLAEIDSKIARLTALRAEVARMTEQCSHGRVAECRVIEVLANHDACLHATH